MARKSTPFNPSAALILALLVSLNPIVAFGDEALRADADSAYAHVIDLSPPAFILGGGRQLSVNLPLFESDSLAIGEAGAIALLLRDGTVARFEGPATISLAQIRQREGNLLARLPKVLMSLLFSKDQEAGDAVLAVRDPLADQPSALKVPRMTFPPHDCRMMNVPRRLAWEELEGVYQYRVRLFDSAQMLWDKHVNTPYADLPEYEALVAPGGTYLWIVQAEIGNETLNSQQARFHILTEERVTEIEQNIAALERAVGDPRLAALLRIRLYDELRLTVERYRELESFLLAYPDDRLALSAKARIFEEMGFYKDASEIYRKLLQP